MAMDRVGDLEINQDLAFQDREWKAQRIGWAVIVVVIVLALSGLFGHGPISWATASSPDGVMQAEFERFGRRGGSQQMVLRVDASAATEGAWQVELSSGFVDGMQVDSTSPEAESVEAVDGGVVYTFTQADPDADLAARFFLTPQGLWRVDSRVSIVGGPRVDLDHFLFP